VLTAVVAFVPMAAPLLLGIIGTILFAQGAVVSGLFIFVVGTLLILVADYVIRPLLIQGSVELPSLAILFGFLGGVATMGIVGLIIGPVILVLLFILLREAAVDESADLEY
jgi:predicted PurR-regulated permease PerM